MAKKNDDTWSVADGNETTGWDNRLTFISPEVLDAIRTDDGMGEPPGDYHTRGEYDHLKNTRIEIDRLDLTDRQLMAVSLVFYGGVKKNRAARAMKITSQALGDHLKAALKKISVGLM